MLHVRRQFAVAHKQEDFMRQFMQNALGLAVALGTGGLMFAVALI
jgi:hypothetical protein